MLNEHISGSIKIITHGKQPTNLAAIADWIIF